MSKRSGVARFCGGVGLGALVACGGVAEETIADEPALGTAEAGLSCPLYVENFDDGLANEVTTGAYRVGWCDTYLPGAINTPPCLLGRTLRTNSSTQNPTLWVNKGTSTCTGVRVSYSYYQFAAANVNLTYRQSNDTSEVCPASGFFTTAASHLTTQSCATQSALIPFGTASGVYIRLQHGSGSNALWVDDVQLTLEGCTSC
jgi:hypothetical protein